MSGDSAKSPLPAMRAQGTNEASSAGCGDERIANGSGMNAAILLKRVRWFILLRWLAVGGVVIAVLIAALLGIIQSAWPLLTVVLAMAVFNGWSHLKMRGDQGQLLAGDRLRRTLLLQILVDITALTLLLHFAGGVENPFILLYFFPLVLSAVLLRPSDSFARAAVATLGFASLAVAEKAGLLAHYHLKCFPHGSVLDLGQASSSEAARYHLPVLLALAVLGLVAFAIVYLVNEVVRDVREVSGREEEGEVRWAQTIAGIQEGVICLRPNLTADCSNQMARRSLGCTHAGNGSCACELELPVALRPRVQCIAEGREIGFTDEVTVAGRSIIHSFFAVRGQAGEVRRIMWLLQDVSQQRRMEREISQHERLAATYELSATLVHEFGNFVDATTSCLRLMEKEANNADSYRLWAKELQNHISSLPPALQSINNFVRRRQILRRPLDLAEVGKMAVEIARQRARGLRVHLELVSSSEPLVVFGDEAHLCVALVNLVANAVDAAAMNGDSRAVVVSCVDDRARESVTVSITDSGPGVAPELREKIFEPFFTTKMPGKGTGLGLPIARRIVQEHGGTITVSGIATHGGTTFTVELPRQREEETSCENVSSS